jgi:hypothetical protein
VSDDHGTRADSVLDDWLTTARSSLHDALDDVLDINTGLHDATLARHRDALNLDLNLVLNAETGLRHILSAHTPLAEYLRYGDTLTQYADDFGALPPHCRLTARSWFPHRELVVLQAVTQATIHAHNLAKRPASDRPIARAVVLELASARTSASALALARARTLASEVYRTSTNGRDFSRDLTRDLDRARALACVLDRASAHHLTSGIDHAAALASDFDLTITSAHGIDRAGAFTLASALASNLDINLNLSRDPNLDINLVAAIDQLVTALTDLTGADLTMVDLNGIPLDGVEWSEETRWPPQWEDYVRLNSHTIGPELYRIQAHGTPTNAPVHTSS